jgi:hypothetical protein
MESAGATSRCERVNGEGRAEESKESARMMRDGTIMATLFFCWNLWVPRRLGDLGIYTDCPPSFLRCPKRVASAAKAVR